MNLFEQLVKQLTDDLWAQRKPGMVYGPPIVSVQEDGDQVRLVAVQSAVGVIVDGEFVRFPEPT